MTVLLYDNPVSGNCYKVRLLLTLLGIEFERRELSVADHSDRAELLDGLSPSLNVSISNERRSAAEIEAKRTAGHAALDVMERHLADHGYFVGERFTIADIALYAYTHVAPEAGFDLEPYPAVSRWLERIAAQPGIVPITG